MPYTRRTYSKPKVIKTKRVYNKRKKPVVYNRLMRSVLNGQVHRFKRRTGSIQDEQANVKTNITCVGGTPYFGCLLPSMAQLPNVAEYSALFDMYQITGVKINFVSRYATTTENLSNNAPTMYTAIDLDDVTIPASINELREHKNCRVHYISNRGRRVYSVYFTPGMAQDVTTSTSSGVIETRRRPWCRFADVYTDNIIFYGVKVALDFNADPGENFYMDLDVIYYFNCKSTR